ncbi:MAG: AAA family ATPase, partial [Ilumatobacter sp.]
VNFLFVDYKGGSAFSECVKLPHCVGLVTDLSPHLVDRALTSLHAELHRREQLFGALDAKDIHELERRGAAETPPALLIVIDEFAALVQEVPDFVNGVVNVAQRGRSLGLHLILATQRPAGVITGNLRANTNLRVALRMADESDSSDVIDVGDAAFIDPGSPGRGFAKVGPGRTFAFQSAFYGGWSSDASNDQHVVVRPLAIDVATPWPAQRAARVAVDQPNDLARLVMATQRAALVGQHPPPRRPWLPELPTDLDLRESPLTRSDAEIVFGSCDLPAQQAQPPISFFPDRDGNLAVFGATGSGKSALLRTIAMVAGSTAGAPDTGDGPCHVYCIDFGSRSLQLLDDFSHVGAVVNADDHERIARLVRELRSTIDERQRRYQSADADTIAQYRERAGRATEPRILLLIDNFGAFRQAYDSPDRAGVLDMLLSLMSDGRSVGVHVVLSADRPAAVPSAVMSLVSRRLALRLANESDYLLLGEPANVLDGETPPGRGVESGREFQVAVLGGTGNIAEQMRLSRALARHDGFVADREPAPPVRRLPQLVRLADLPAAVADRPTLGIDDATLSPIGFEPVGAFMVAGPPGSGRTTAIGAIAVSLARHQPSIQRVLFAERRSSLAPLARWTTVAERPREHADLAAAITADLLAVEGEVSGLAIFVENVTEALEQAEVEAALTELIKTALAHDAFVVVEGEASMLARAWKLDVVKNQRTGLLLQPQPGDGELLKVNLPRAPQDQFPSGRGFVVARRNVAKVQVAVPDAE